ncbi:DNA methyltransferase [Nereida sp. MMG025]|uniref:site-specific DNA-methyltransferase n=1 Tax=Nereida sp. MMG025 TaxID=2909981 RepID=UPI001F2D4F94|nr:DNA methyltransferase [Nereida sp. MMG025]MCF6446100.1 site-specific DNA-methyltransferase [Nereida sp. MMG025]
MKILQPGFGQHGVALPIVEMRAIAELIPYAGNARTHSRKQIKQIARSIETFGFTNPVLISNEGGMLAGHGRVEAAKLLGWSEVPTLCLAHLSAEQQRAYILADNRLAEKAGWDEEILAIELQFLVEAQFDLDVTGFEIAEIDGILYGHDDRGIASSADVLPAGMPSHPVTKFGDLWQLGPRVLLCGNALNAADVAKLMDGQAADLIFTDLPYNVPIDGHVTGKGKHKHREFAFASGEMSPDEFKQFLTTSLSNASRVCRDGAIAFVCMDWRHMREVMDAGEVAFDALKNLCVWNKTNAGMGTFYRSKHELVFVFKKGSVPHTNSFGLGETGRYRTNVWDYDGVNVPTQENRDALAMHPTVKPVHLIEDAIKDCTRRGERVLDVFGGSGSTLIAAERAGRVAHLLELDPLYCDTILARYWQMTGCDPIRVSCGAAYSVLAKAAGSPASDREGA